MSYSIVDCLRHKGVTLAASLINESRRVLEPPGRNVTRIKLIKLPVSTSVCLLIVS
jgi:hypothetical protein